MTPYGHGRNPNHVREQGQRKWHFWISMVSATFFSETVRCRDMAREYRIESCNRRVTKKKFMKFWHRAAEIWDLEDGQNCDFPSLISQQPYVRTSWNFFGDSPITTLNSIFPGHVSAPHHFWEKIHGWNHGNQKMPIFLAMFSDVVGILPASMKDNVFDNSTILVSPCTGRHPQGTKPVQVKTRPPESNVTRCAIRTPYAIRPFRHLMSK